MRSRISLFAILFITISFAVPLAAHAAALPFFGPIIDQSWTVSDTGIQCALGWGAVITVVNNIIRLLLTLAIVFVMPITIAYAGFLMVVNPTSIGDVSKAKTIILNTVIGIVISLAAWLIVNAIMAALTSGPNGPSFASNWSSLITSGNALTCLPQQGVGTGLNQSTDGGAGVVVVTPAANCAALYATNLPGITVSSTGNCCDKTKPTCTALDGMLLNTIQQIINVKNKCGAITVTGGTEVGHSGEGNVGSHSGGSKVDISQNLISCISGTTGSTVIASPSFGSAQVKDKCGNIYTWEGNHTDISVVSICSL
ncbi:MAG: hypothetical protein Q8O94_00310 [bacterium]|nr:hypothetical protein [bacterium]